MVFHPVGCPLLVYILASFRPLVKGGFCFSSISCLFAQLHRAAHSQSARRARPMATRASSRPPGSSKAKACMPSARFCARYHASATVPEPQLLSHHARARRGNLGPAGSFFRPAQTKRLARPASAWPPARVPPLRATARHPAEAHGRCPPCAPAGFSVYSLKSIQAHTAEAFAHRRGSAANRLPRARVPARR